MPLTVIIQLIMSNRSVVFGKYDRWLESFGLLKIHKCVRDYYHRVANLTFAGRRAVKTNTSAAAFPFYDISLYTFTVVVVDNLNFLSRYHTGGIHKILVNGNAAHIVKIGFSYFYAMQLAF